MRILRLLLLLIALVALARANEPEISIDEEFAPESAEFEQPEENVEPASLVAHKQILSDFPSLLSIGAQFSVSIDVYNIGNGSAYEVEIKDQWPLESFDLVEGDMNVTLDVLEAGANYTLKFTLVPKQEGQLRSSYGIVSYKPLQSLPYPLYLLTSRPLDQSIFSADVYRKFTRSQTVRFVSLLNPPSSPLNSSSIGSSIGAVSPLQSQSQHPSSQRSEHMMIAANRMNNLKHELSSGNKLSESSIRRSAD